MITPESCRSRRSLSCGIWFDPPENKAFLTKPPVARPGVVLKIAHDERLGVEHRVHAGFLLRLSEQNTGDDTFHNTSLRNPGLLTL
jgi:hypothetical protein